MGMSASQARMLSLTSRLSDLELRAQSISNSKIRLADESEAASRSYSEALNKEKLTVYAGVNGDGISVYKDATASNLTGYHIISTTDKQRFLKNSYGQIIVNQDIADVIDVSNNDVEFLDNMLGYHDKQSADDARIEYDGAAITHYTNLWGELFNDKDDYIGYSAPPPSNDELNSPEWLHAQLSAGNIFLSEWDDDAGKEGTGDFVDVSWSSGDVSIRAKTDNTDLARAEAQYETAMADIQSKDKRFDLQLKEIDTEHNAIQTEVDSVKKVIDKNIEKSFKIFEA